MTTAADILAMHVAGVSTAMQHNFTVLEYSCLGSRQVNKNCASKLCAIKRARQKYDYQYARKRNILQGFGKW